MVDIHHLENNQIAILQRAKNRPTFDEIWDTNADLELDDSQ